MDDGAAEATQGGRERIISEVDASRCLVLLPSSLGFAACGALLLAVAAAQAVLMLGLASLARVVLHGLAARPKQVVGYICLLLRLVLMRLRRSCRCSP